MSVNPGATARTDEVVAGLREMTNLPLAPGYRSILTRAASTVASLADQRNALLTAAKEIDSWRMQSLDMMPPEIRGAWMRLHDAVENCEGQ